LSINAIHEGDRRKDLYEGKIFEIDESVKFIRAAFARTLAVT